MSCRKREYATKADAKRAVARQQSLIASGKNRARRIYRCGLCGFWHATSQPANHGRARK